MLNSSLRRAACVAFGTLCVMVSSRALSAQDIAPPSRTLIPMWIDSGSVTNTATDPALQNTGVVVWSTIVSAPGHSSIRLHYEGVVLAGRAEPGRRGSFLRMTSLLDRAIQTQHSVHVSQWDNTSAYFNGDAVLVELVAFPGTGINRFTLREVEAGNPPIGGIDSICGTTDDRQQSFDTRQGRNQPGGCTSWLIDDCEHCFLTAGHCTGNLQVVEFNVPLSNGNGSLNHPPPSDQYAVDPCSVQSNGGQGIGNDYAYFGVFPNSVTGLTPYEANGNSTYVLIPPPPVTGQNIRITGYGSTQGGLPATLNLVQKTHVGPYFSFSGTRVRYTTDTTGGNSGSPVLLDGTDLAIGIHTHAGCDPANNGTASTHPALQAALADPQGVCLPPALDFTVAGGVPSFVDSAGSTAISVVVAADDENVPQPGTGQLHVDTGTGTFSVIAMTETSPNNYNVSLPPSGCSSDVRFFFSAQTVGGTLFTSPRDGASDPFVAVSAASTTTAVAYDFNAAVPWTTDNTGVSDGAWVRGTPSGNNGSRRDPTSDFDGSGLCWVTGNGNNEDVDDGPTILITETFDLSSTSDPYVRYARWFQNDDDDDQWVTSISDDGGSTWTPIDTAQGDTKDWQKRQFRILDFTTTLDQIRFRFSVGDVPNNSITEGALDAFEIVDVVCATGPTATWTTVGTGCAGTAGVPLLSNSTVPALGQNLAVIASSIPPSGIAFGTIGFAPVNPLPLDAIGMTGCTLYSPPDITVMLGGLGSSFVVWTLPLSTDPSLVGVTFVQQVFITDPSANPLGLTATNAGEAVVGF